MTGNYFDCPRVKVLFCGSEVKSLPENSEVELLFKFYSLSKF